MFRAVLREKEIEDIGEVINEFLKFLNSPRFGNEVFLYIINKYKVEKLLVNKDLEGVSSTLYSNTPDKLEGQILYATSKGVFRYGGAYVETKLCLTLYLF